VVHAPAQGCASVDAAVKVLMRQELKERKQLRHVRTKTLIAETRDNSVPMLPIKNSWLTSASSRATYAKLSAA